MPTITPAFRPVPKGHHFDHSGSRNRNPIGSEPDDLGQRYGHDWGQ
jgi:hypothetical protein